MRTGKKDQERRRESAEACQQERAGRTDRQQLDRLDAGGHTAAKERERLENRMNE